MDGKQAAAGNVTTDLEVKSMGKQVAAGEQHEQLPLEEFPAGALATASVGISLTVNMGNYESVKVSVNVNLPTEPKNMDAALERAKDTAGQYLLATALPEAEEAFEKYRKNRQAGRTGF